MLEENLGLSGGFSVIFSFFLVGYRKVGSSLFFLFLNEVFGGNTWCGRKSFVHIEEGIINVFRLCHIYYHHYPVSPHTYYHQYPFSPHPSPHSNIRNETREGGREEQK